MVLKQEYRSEKAKIQVQQLSGCYIRISPFSSSSINDTVIRKVLSGRTPRTLGMKQNPDEKNTVKSDRTLFSIIEGIKDLDGAGITELAEHISTSNSTVQRHINTLYDEGYISKKDGKYQLGYRFLDLGGYVRSQHELSGLIKSKVRALAQSTGQLANFHIEEFGCGVIVYRETGEDVGIEAQVGKRVPLHTTGGGKAILAHLPDEQVEKIIGEQGLPKLTEHTITDPDTLIDELEDVREQGYAVDREGYAEKLYAVGVPVQTSDGVVLGALSIAGPAHALEGEKLEKELPRLLIRTADEIEISLSYS